MIAPNIRRIFGFAPCLSVAAIALLMPLAGCGTRQDDPPTDDEIFKAFGSLWADHVEDFSKLFGASSGAVELPLQKPASGSGDPEDQDQGDRRDAYALWLSACPRPAPARRLAGQRQAGEPPLLRNRPAITEQ